MIDCNEWEDRETPRMRKYEESKTTRIMMATVPHVTSASGLRKFQADGSLLYGVFAVCVLPKYPRSGADCLQSACREVITWRWRVQHACAAYRAALNSLHFMSLLTLLRLNTFLRPFIQVRCPDVCIFFGVFYVTWERYLHVACEEKWPCLNVRSSDKFLFYFSDNRT